MNEKYMIQPSTNGMKSMVEMAWAELLSNSEGNDITFSEAWLLALNKSSR